MIKKRIHVRVEHVMPCRCNEEFLQRKRSNEILKQEVKARGLLVNTKREPDLPNPGFMVDVSKLETVTPMPIPYDVVNDRSQGLMLIKLINNW